MGCGSLERLASVFGLKSGIAQAQLWGMVEEYNGWVVAQTTRG